MTKIYSISMGSDSIDKLSLNLHNLNQRKVTRDADNLICHYTSMYTRNVMNLGVKFLFYFSPDATK